MIGEIVILFQMLVSLAQVSMIASTLDLIPQQKTANLHHQPAQESHQSKQVLK